MNRGALLFIGVFLTFAIAWVGLVYVPHAQLGSSRPAGAAPTTQPRAYSTMERAGRDVYQREGCVYCHTQQVRGGRYQADVQRGWGPRRSHPGDYVHDDPVLLGTMRTGPDLLNIGARQSSRSWHLLHLYNPQKQVPGSIMPPYPHLFEKRRQGARASMEALTFDERWGEKDGRPPEGWEVVPTRGGEALVEYLRSLDRTYELEAGSGGGSR